MPFFTLFKSLVLPILEYYCIPCWGAHTVSQQQQIERGQRTATRIALKQRCGQMSYEDHRLAGSAELIVTFITKRFFAVLLCI